MISSENCLLSEIVECISNLYPLGRYPSLPYGSSPAQFDQVGNELARALALPVHRLTSTLDWEVSIGFKFLLNRDISTLLRLESCLYMPTYRYSTDQLRLLQRYDLLDWCFVYISFLAPYYTFNLYTTKPPGVPAESSFDPTIKFGSIQPHLFEQAILNQILTQHGLTLLDDALVRHEIDNITLEDGEGGRRTVLQCLFTNTDFMPD